MTTCPEITMLAELALDVLPANQHAVVVAHLEDCMACRTLLHGFVETADQLLLALPPIDPPPRFAAAVVARLSSPPSQRRLAPSVQWHDGVRTAGVPSSWPPAEIQMHLLSVVTDE